MPLANEENLGGHAMLIVGYDDTTGTFIVCNSWGVSWADKGFCYIPYAYILNKRQASDFWCIQYFK
jgi:C1A family cysteine protease